MKIAIISTARSRSTALASYIAKQHYDLEYLWEVYTDGLTKGRTIMDMTHDVFSTKTNFVIKILGQNISVDQKLPGFVGNNNIISPKQLCLKDYDDIHLIERHDYFHQVCSYHVAQIGGVWNQLKTRSIDRFAEVADKKFNINKLLTNNITGDIVGYLTIKKYLIDNNIPFKLYESELDLTKEISDQASTVANDLNYELMVHNYHLLKPEFNSRFAKYFNYKTCMHNYHALTNELFEFIKDDR